MSPEWEYRYYSFKAKWSDAEMMASMRNGSGDEWWMVFHQDGWAALKGLTHESEVWDQGRESLSKALQEAMPSSVHSFATEPAFDWDATSFAYYFLPSENEWRRANEQTLFKTLDADEDQLLHLLTAGPEAYVSFAENYYETPVPLQTVSRIYKHTPITEEMASSLNSGTSFDEITAELHDEIGYPV